MGRGRTRLLISLVLLGLGMGLVRIASPPRIVVTWETASEVDTAGFHIYRALQANGPFELVTGVPIPAQGDPLVGSSYRYEDRDVAWGKLYHYQLAEVERDGAQRRYDRIVSARAGAGWAWAIAGGALLAGLWWFGTKLGGR
jgi:hypothetical protein